MTARPGSGAWTLVVLGILPVCGLGFALTAWVLVMLGIPGPVAALVALVAAPAAYAGLVALCMRALYADAAARAR